MAGLIDRAAGRLADFLAARRSSEPRSPDESRIGYSGRTTAGVVITPDTAMLSATVWACIRYLSQTTAMLPWRVMRETEKGSELAARHPLDYLLHKRPSKDWGSFQFRETLTHWALRWGNGYAEIERNGMGQPIALWPIHPERVDPKRDLDTGELVFEISNGSAPRTILAAEDMFHIRGFGEGPVGVNVIAYAAETIGWARAAQLFGAAFFGNGMNVAGVVQVKQGMEPAGFAKLKAELKNLYGGPRKAMKTPILDNGMEWKSVGIEPEKGQFIATNQHLVEEQCRWFGVPPHKVMHLLRSTFNNIEHQSIEVVQDSILPWVKRFEEEADFKLFGQNRRGFYTKMNLRALLRGDFKSQQEGLEIARRNGVLNGDEWREFLDMNALPDGAGGDKYVMQSQYTTVERIGEEPAQAEPAPAQRGHNGGPPMDDDEEAPGDLVDRINRLRSATHG